MMPNKNTAPWRAAARLIAVACVLAIAGCATPEQRVATQEDRLAAAGFMVQPANTEARQNMLKTLPSHRFLQRVHGNTVSYVYADPLVCGCLYVGSEQAYDHYKLLMLQQKIADEQELTAEMYNNAAWNWGAWGPWGPGFAYGPGW